MFSSIFSFDLAILNNDNVNIYYIVYNCNYVYLGVYCFVNDCYVAISMLK